MLVVCGPSERPESAAPVFRYPAHKVAWRRKPEICGCKDVRGRTQGPMRRAHGRQRPAASGRCAPGPGPADHCSATAQAGQARFADPGQDGCGAEASGVASRRGVPHRALISGRVCFSVTRLSNPYASSTQSPLFTLNRACNPPRLNTSLRSALVSATTGVDRSKSWNGT